MPSPSQGAREPGLALTLFGGGARAAYQVGVLRGLGRAHPELDPSILTGISAGAINAAHLGNSEANFGAATEELEALWRSIDVDSVFETRGLALLHRAACIGMRLAIGWAPTLQPLDGMVDSTPLRRFLEASFGGQDLPGIQANIDSGRLKAIALIALRYSTGQTVSFTAGREFRNWERPLRHSVRTDLKVDHVLASAALPLFFAPVEVDGEWYGDGGVRLTAPLAPAVHLGADRVLAISTRFRPSEAEARKPRFKGPPRAAQILGNLMSATFLDVLDQDAMHLERINRLVAGMAPGERHELRPIKCLVIRPSRDIASLANEFEPKLPGTFRFLTRRWGTRRARSQELLSTILFQGDYIRRLMEVGEEDGANKADAVADLLTD